MWSLLLVASVLVFAFNVECCNEAICGSIVSKCLLIKSCNCDMKSRVCSKECYICLGQLYSECCSCVGMCPMDIEGANSLSKKSHVEDFFEPVPDLFSVLTEFPDEYDRWNITVYPVEVDISGFPEKEINLRKKMPNIENNLNKNSIIVLNCTVVFWSHCMSLSKCKGSCLSMGASSYRWFHDGCCECVGQHCVNYGINESRCSSCPFTDEEVENEMVDENELDYGEDDNYDDFIG